jgi:predicted nucleic acid-binding protein
VVEPTERLALAPDEPDIRVLEAASQVASMQVVTGDRGLLMLTALGEIPLVTPAECLALLRAEASEGSGDEATP